MAIWDAVSDMLEAVAPWGVVQAEAPAEASKEEESAKSKNDEADSAGDSEAAEGEDEEEEEEEEIVDPKVTLEEECKQSAHCAPVKHHFDECVERVQQQESDGGAKEDCVEEFFHLAHCATTCAAPKLWSQLK